MNLKLLKALIDIDPENAIMLINKHEQKKHRYKKLEIIDLCLKMYNEEFGLHIKFEDLQTKNNNIQKSVLPRQIIHYFYRYFTKKTLKEIGWLVGKKDYTTVLHSVKVIENYIETDKQIRSLINRIEKVLTNVN